MKKIKIGVVSSGRSLVDTTRKLAIEKGIDIHSAYVGLDDAIEIAKEMESDGIEVVLARGGTAPLVRNHIQVPVLSFPLSTIDLLKCIREAANFGRNILLVSFTKRMKGIEFANELFNIRLTQSVCKNYDDMLKLISTRCDKYDAMVGGSTSSAVAKEYGLNAVETQTSEEAIDSTLDSAISVAKYNWIEREKTLRFGSIIDGVSDGIIAYDQEGKITTINEKAHALLKVDQETATGKSVNDLLPRSTGMSVIFTRLPIADKIERIGSELFVFNHIPIVINHEAVGVVTTFKDASNVIEVESEIRRSLSKGLIAKYNLSDLIYKSDSMKKMIERVKRFASTGSTITIVGETGTGKEILAQSIHNLSPRTKQAFVSINCAALSEQLLESELFGYEEGAFTGSRKGGKPGLFETAHKGTIFLDEIGATSQNVQRHLLRVLQEREVMRIGADRIIPVNVRVIAASNQELVEEVNKGRFREDLFFRLNVLSINIPPLRNRLEDLPYLVKKFLIILSLEYKKEPFQIPDRCIKKLQEYFWPGNVRQLKNFIERLFLICDSGFNMNVFDELFIELIEYRPKKFSANIQSQTDSLKDQLKANTAQNEYETIKRALEVSNFSKTKAAKLLGISRTTLWKKLKLIKYNSAAGRHRSIGIGVF
jgi:transcriptional regulator with PAS, ATPase and Fis domain